MANSQPSEGILKKITNAVPSPPGLDRSIGRQKLTYAVLHRNQADAVFFEAGSYGELPQNKAKKIPAVIVGVKKNSEKEPAEIAVNYAHVIFGVDAVGEDENEIFCFDARNIAAVLLQMDKAEFLEMFRVIYDDSGLFDALIETNWLSSDYSGTPIWTGVVTSKLTQCYDYVKKSNLRMYLANKAREIIVAGLENHRSSFYSGERSINKRADFLELLAGLSYMNADYRIDCPSCPLFCDEALWVCKHGKIPVLDGSVSAVPQDWKLVADMVTLWKHMWVDKYKVSWETDVTSTEIMEQGKLVGLDTSIEALVAGVPLEDILI